MGDGKTYIYASIMALEIAKSEGFSYQLFHNSSEL